MKKKISIFLVAFLMLFNLYQIDYNTKKIEINKPVEAIEPVTAYLISQVVAGICLGLGYSLVESTGESFEQGCMNLYYNFSQNVKNIIDRIVNEKTAGKNTYNITHDELKQIDTEVKAYGILSSEEFDYSYSFTINPESYGSNSVHVYNDFDIKSLCYDSGFVQYGSWLPINITKTNIDTGVTSVLNTRLKIDNPNGRFYFQQIFDNGSTGNIAYNDYNHPQDGYKPTLHVGDYQYSGNLKYRYMHLNFIGTVWNDAYFDKIKIRIDVGEKKSVSPIMKYSNVDIDELLRLFAIADFNGTRVIEQNFIENYSISKPSDVYTDVGIKTVVDGLFDGADTNVPEVPQDWTILQSMYHVLRDLYQSVRTGINTISNTLSQVLSNVKAIPHTIATTITSLFVPPEGFMTPLITDFQDSMAAKFGDRTIDLTQFSSTRVPEDIEITIMGQTVKVFESQPLIDFVEAVRAWIIGFIGILAMIYNFNNVYRLFAGAEYVGSTGSSQLNSQGMLQGNNDGGYLKLGGGK